MDESYELEEKLFTEALALPAAERAAFSKRTCGENAALLIRLEALLSAHEKTAEFLDAPPEQELMEATRIHQAVLAEISGSQIGRYKLLGKLGEGGCGVVFRAKQTEPVRREVALKIIKLGMDTRSVIGRFEAERQALALMEHPNIARALDAGSTEAGRPFFVMELVQGQKITDFCDQNRLLPEARLKLFLPICRAIQHAHQKGVIHGDLKPSNILVTSNDDEPVPKVIDFGIAKATQGHLDDGTSFTIFDQFVGTPAYMSPEQAEGGGSDVDTRSDIYSLGVLLYELLTGCTPINPSALLKMGVDQIRRQIRESEPLKPSAQLKLISQSAIATIASNRRLTPARLFQSLSGDLDWIVMRCLEKDRTRRYVSANDLARDIDRFLTSEPVDARPPTVAYTLRKFTRRHRTLFIAGGAIVLTLLAGFTVSTILYFREKTERQRAVIAEQAQKQLRQQAEREEKAAQSEADRNAQFVRFLKDMLSGVGPAVARGRDTALLREILDATALRLNQELGSQPDLQAELRETLASVYAALGEQSRAETLRRMIVATRRNAQETRAKDLALADALNRLGETLTQFADPIEAERLHREALAIQQKWLKKANFAIADTLVDIAQALSNQNIVNQVNRLAEAETDVREAVSIEEKVSGHARPSTLGVLGSILRHAQKYAQAEAVFRQLIQTNPNDADVLYQLGDALAFTGKLREAEMYQRKSLAIEKTMLNAENPQLATIGTELAGHLIHDSQPTEAQAVASDAVALGRRLLAREPANKNFKHSLAASLEIMGTALFENGKYKEAEGIHREGQKLHGEAMSNQNREGVDFMHDIANDLEAEGDLIAAESYFRTTLTADEQFLSDRVADSIYHLNRILVQEHKPWRQDPYWADAIKAAQAAANRSKRQGPKFVAALTMMMVVNGKTSEAEPLVRDFLSRTENFDPSNFNILFFHWQLGAIFASEGRFEEAEKLMLDAYARMIQRRWIDMPPSEDAQLHRAASSIAKLYKDWRKPAESDKWLGDEKSLGNYDISR